MFLLKYLCLADDNLISTNLLTTLQKIIPKPKQKHKSSYFIIQVSDILTHSHSFKNYVFRIPNLLKTMLGTGNAIVSRRKMDNPLPGLQPSTRFRTVFLLHYITF